MRALFVLLLAVVSFVGCKSHLVDYTPKPGVCRTFIVAPEFTAEERAALASSVERWNDIAIEPFCLRDSATPGEVESTLHGVFRIAYNGPYWQQLSKKFGGANVIGVHFGDTDQIGIVDTLGQPLFEAVAVHEFGHAHGLGHTQPPSIMAAYAGSAYDFTENDLAECRRVGACESGDPLVVTYDVFGPPTDWVLVR